MEHKLRFLYPVYTVIITTLHIPKTGTPSDDMSAIIYIYIFKRPTIM